MKNSDAPYHALSVPDIINAIFRTPRVFWSVLIVGVLLTAVTATLYPRSYVSTTVILPPQQQQSSAANALAQLGALAGSMPVTKTPDELYVALLKTRRLQEQIIKRFDLKSKYKKKTIQQARKKLSDTMSIVSDKKSGLITIEVEDRDAELSAAIANGTVEELRKLLATIATTEAQQRRMFFEQQVEKTKNALNEAEITFRRTQAESGLVISQALAESGVKEGAQLRIQIAAKEVQRQAMEKFYTPQNPELVKLEAELAAMKAQLSRLELGSGVNDSSSNKNLKAVQAYRNMRVQDGLLEILIKQYEAARADEAREGPLMQQVDVAVPQEEPSKPNIPILLLVGAFLSFALASSCSVCLDRRSR